MCHGSAQQLLPITQWGLLRVTLLSCISNRVFVNWLFLVPLGTISGLLACPEDRDIETFACLGGSIDRADGFMAWLLRRRIRRSLKDWGFPDAWLSWSCWKSPTFLGWKGIHEFLASSWIRCTQKIQKDRAQVDWSLSRPNSFFRGTSNWPHLNPFEQSDNVRRQGGPKGKQETSDGHVSCCRFAILRKCSLKKCCSTSMAASWAACPWRTFSALRRSGSANFRKWGDVEATVGNCLRSCEIYDDL